jgi:hypothetical protein
MGSTGCGTAVTQTARQWIEATPLDVSGAMRRFWTYLPNNYDPMRRYPVVYLFHGCGNETNNVNMQNVVGENAILVRGKAVSDCWVTSANSADIAFFDALVMTPRAVVPSATAAARGSSTRSSAFEAVCFAPPRASPAAAPVVTARAQPSRASSFTT